MPKQQTTSDGASPTRFQILSLDGGGIKGVFSAAVLAAIEADLGISVVDHFDLIAGTSTGGIIAIALGLGIRPKEILQFYLEVGPKLFPKSFGWRKVQMWFRRKYSSYPLEAAVRHRFKERAFGESTKRLIITSYNLGEDDIYLFRTAHHERLRRDYKIPAWKVAMATSAAPTFFPSFKGVDHQRLIDGGVWANNPAMVAVIEAKGTLGIPLSAIHLLSIGTSSPVKSQKTRLDSGGLFAWGRGNAAVDVIMRGQSIGVQNQVSFLLGKDHVARLDPKVPDGDFSLDGAHTVDDLIAKAAHHSREFAPGFKEQFCDHHAPRFTPLYPPNQQ